MLQDEVRALATERGAVILAHNYQVPEVQDVAHYVGDSLGLSRAAAASDEEVIVFCGVHFMAETASVLCPEKTVLIPDLDAGCSLAASIDAEQLKAWKAEHPGGVVVMYVNTTAEVKALTDYCCTSANAVEVVRHIYETHGEETEILFGPDMWLGAYVEKELGRPMHVWDGECHVHAGIRPRDIDEIRAAHPGADFLIHPECGCTTSVMEYVAAGDVAAEGVHMLSTGGMLRYAREAEAEGETGAGGTGRALPAREPAGELRVHEDDHAPEASGRAARDEVRGARAPGDRSACANPDRSYGGYRLRRP
jgi:quinolinate synthase